MGLLIYQELARMVMDGRFAEARTLVAKRLPNEARRKAMPAGLIGPQYTTQLVVKGCSRTRLMFHVMVQEPGVDGILDEPTSHIVEARADLFEGLLVRSVSVSGRRAYIETMLDHLFMGILHTPLDGDWQAVA